MNFNFEQRMNRTCSQEQPSKTSIGLSPTFKHCMKSTALLKRSRLTKPGTDSYPLVPKPATSYVRPFRLIQTSTACQPNEDQAKALAESRKENAASHSEILDAIKNRNR